MPLNIKDPRTDRLARELSRVTGESLTGAITVAVEERLERLRGSARRADLVEELDEIALRAAALPVLDDRSADELLDYDEHGLPR